jgi:branched-chain amino acid transport system permease protein
MNDLVTFTIVGLSTASILGVAASGLVVTYQTSGIFNFAHGAIGMLGAFAYWQLRFGWGWPAPLALVVVLLVLAPLLGTLIERVVVRGLEGTRDVTRIVVPISLLVAMVGIATWVWPPEGRAFPPLFAGEKIQVGDVFITWHQLITAVCAVVTAVGLRLILYRTRVGITMRAVVDDRDLVELNSGDPHRSARFAWVLGAQLAALAGILVAPNIRLSAVGLTLLVVNAYSAAIVGRLKSLPMTFVGALLLGLLDAYAVGYLPTDNDYLAAFRLAIPSLFLFLALLMLPQARLRGHAPERRRESTGVSTVAWTASGGVVLVILVVLVTAFVAPSTQLDLGVSLGLALIALSLVPLVGYAGQISLCQMSFAAIGAMMMAQFGGTGSLWGLFVAVLATSAIGALIALPTLRLQGLYLALATGAFAVFLDVWVFTLRKVDVWGLHLDLFSGGSLTVPRLDVLSVSFDSTRASVILLAIVFALCGVFVVWLRHGRFGRRLIALRTSPAAAATLGIDVRRTRLSIFAVSAAMAGLGGALLAGMRGGSSAEQFSFVQSLVLLMMTVAGGISLVGGAFFAGVSTLLFDVIADAVPSLDNAVLVLPGLVGIGLARHPDGVVSQIATGYRPLRAAPVILVGSTAAVIGIVGIRAADLVDDQVVVAVIAIVLSAAPLLAARAGSRRAVGAPSGDAVGSAPPDAASVPLERQGLQGSWSAETIAQLDEVLGLEPG